MARCESDAAFRVIVGGEVPDFRTISDFRKIHLPVMQAMFVEVLRLCAEAGLVKVGRLALDGTKIKANASRLKKIREAKAALEEALEEQARRKAREHAAQLEAEGGTPRKDPEEAVPKGKDQRNFTDPESKIMKTSNKGFDQCGNAQAVANEQQIIVAADVTNQANDVRQVEPPLAQTQANLQAAGVDEKPKDVLADAGYFSEENMHATEARGMTPFIATQRLKHNEAIPESPQGRTPRDLSAKQRMARKLRTKKRRETYSKRKRMIEPVFGQIKACRHFLHCQIRGLHQMQGEWTLV